MKKTILIFPWARNAPDGGYCAKNYPFWREVITSLKEKGVTTIQVSGKGEEQLNVDEVKENLPMEVLVNLIRRADSFISVDSFAPHFAYFYKKYGVVIFSKSDPEIFGYTENINLLKDKKYLRRQQFEYWNGVKMEPESFVSPEIVVAAAMKTLNGI